MVRLKQRLYDLGEGLLTVPLAFVLGALVLARVMLEADNALADDRIPRALETTVEGSRSILTAIAGGLISSVTLLLSLVLVAVQLASSQFSPRTLQDWTGDRTQQVTIGLVLGTSVYCLLILRETRTIGDGDVLIPHLSVLLAVSLGVLSLIAVVLSVDRLTRSLRVGALARSITDRTTELIHDRGRSLELENPELRPANPAPRDEDELPLDALVVTSEGGGWVQQIDEDKLFEAIPSGSIAVMATAVGSHILPKAPLATVWPPPEDERCVDKIRAAVGIGQERSAKEDVGYGMLQLVDVAVRALSPGINDPNTANDIIVNLGVILLAIWEYPERPLVRSDGGRTLVRRDLGHHDYLVAGFGPLRRYGVGDPSVVETMVTTLSSLRAETKRRRLPGPSKPIEDTIDLIVDAFLATDPAPVDADGVLSLLGTNGPPADDVRTC